MSQTGGTLYAIRAEGTSLVKIGYTRDSVETRLKRLQTGQPFPLQVIATLPVESDARHWHALSTAARRAAQTPALDTARRAWQAPA